MGVLLFWIFLLFPVAEVYVLIKVGSRIGFWYTLFLLIFSAVFGSYLAKIQGKMALERIQACLAEGRMPTNEMIDGVLIFIGGLLFVFPGFISDGLGLLLIFPPTRFLVRIFFLRSVQTDLEVRSSRRPMQSPAVSQEKKPLSREGAEDAEIVD
jgi:UPF0716 protein FxsA